ncbi:rab11 family-interacting protein 4A [Pleuronectes platessa]|uniref:rab11 family-interacting protein 4A n=1 Tax=Pleuronectes platessa TaxID=8262 RepID=UPI00232A4B44|nr:rab11 family-interacting protein 4A [Pleuronectes platessa]
MDEEWNREPEHLLTILRKLREVFDVCDEDADGFIRPEHLVQLGSQFGQEEQVKRLAKCLDPNAHGRINFRDFCCGVLTMKGYVLNFKKKSSTHETAKSYYQFAFMYRSSLGQCVGS